LGNGKSRPGFPKRLWDYSRQFVLLHHGAEKLAFHCRIDGVCK
jgi:hypothetical protein